MDTPQSSDSTLPHDEAAPQAPLSPEFLEATNQEHNQAPDHEVTPDAEPAPKLLSPEARAELRTADDVPPVSVKHTYPDGCEVFGVPPFPEMSPLEVRAKELRDATPPQDTVARAEAAKEAAAIAAQQAAQLAAAANLASANQPAGIVTATDVQQHPDA